MKNQGFIPNSSFQSVREDESDDYETDSEYETDDDDNDSSNQHGSFKGQDQSTDSNTNSNGDLYYKSEMFVVEDPFIEVKDEQIECVDESSEMIHLKSGFTLCGKLRKKRRCGFGSLTGVSLERKGTKFCIRY